MPQALAHFFLEGKIPLVITGTHGKTTTSALLASLLDQAGLSPGFMVGGILKGYERNYQVGSGPYFVIEGDEYDTAFFDKGPKFLHYRPYYAVLTSIEFDHADIYPDLKSIQEAFARFIALLPEEGLLADSRSGSPDSGDHRPGRLSGGDVWPGGGLGLAGEKCSDPSLRKHLRRVSARAYFSEPLILRWQGNTTP